MSGGDSSDEEAVSLAFPALRNGQSFRVRFVGCSPATGDAATSPVGIVAAPIAMDRRNGLDEAKSFATADQAAWGSNTT